MRKGALCKFCERDVAEETSMVASNNRVCLFRLKLHTGWEKILRQRNQTRSLYCTIPPLVSDAHFRSKVPSKKWNYLSHEINNYFPARKGSGQIMRMKKRKAYQISKCRMLHLEVRNAIYYVAFQLDVLAAILSEGLIFPHVHWLPSAVLVIAIMSISKREVI